MDALIIVPESNLIAVSNKDKFRVLSEGDLASCIKRNKIYLCEQHQVLHTDLSNSCIGSIYSNFESGIKTNCKLERRPLLETVYQLNAHEYLIYTPKPYKTTIVCKNGQNKPIYLTTVYKLDMPEECEIVLKSHTITSDYNIRISPPPLNIPWSLDPMKLPAEILLDAALIDQKLFQLKQDLETLHKETSTKTDFTKLLNTEMDSPFSYPWFIWAAIIAAISALGLLIFWYIYNKIQDRKFQAQQVLTTTFQPQQPSSPPIQSMYPPLYKL